MLEYLGKICIYILIKILEKTLTFHIYDEDRRLSAMQQHPEKSYLLACWHEHLLSVLFTQKKHNFYTLASKSRGGRIIGFLCKRFHYKVIYGSQDRSGKDKGGVKALIALVKVLEKGFPVALTVDGSIGPRREVKAGIIDLGRRAHTAILPVASATSKQWVFRTWDEFKLPKPFATIVVQLGNPISIPHETSKNDVGDWQKKLALAINEQEKEAEKKLQLLLQKL